MKGMIEGQCGQSNALVGLSKNFSQNNARLNSGVDAQIRGVMPNLARGEQFADEYLRGLSAQTAAPGSFNMKSLARNLPQTNSATDLSRNWTADYSRRQQNFVPSTLANQWNRQYLAQQPSSQIGIDLEPITTKSVSIFCF
uniref:Uncharacterized protein n=1 Tax=Panagrolaimus sp. JU765 TaxID=591449 RepID=A0AC34QXE0_9BILA